MDASIDQDSIISALRAELSPFHYQWLCACAVYPGLRWPLTVWLGASLAERQGREPPDEDAHLPLIRLPWFREGAIPDNMRLRLLRDLSPENRDFVRKQIEALFAAARPAGDAVEDGYVLDLKRPPRFTLTNLLKRLLARPGEAARPPEDAIFVHYMMGRVPSALDLELDRRFARLVGARLAGFMGWRTLLASCAAIALALLAWEAGALVEQRWTMDVVNRTIDLPAMVRIPTGRFAMGSPESEAVRGADESPQHEVTLKSFDIGKYEVTFKDWDECVADGGCNSYKPEDQGWGRESRPVINVSWDDAQTYVKWLNAKTGGNRFRLPSEAEWEYAARARTTTPYPWGEEANEKLANYNSDKTVPAGQFPPNDFKLHDMHGNVWEWVEDVWHDNYADAPRDGSAWIKDGDDSLRVLRGGSWVNSPRVLRSASRNWLDPVNRDVNIGFRVARTPFTP